VPAPKQTQTAKVLLRRFRIVGRIIFWTSFGITGFHYTLMIALLAYHMIPVCLLLSFGMIAGATLRWQLVAANVCVQFLAFVLLLVFLAIWPDDPLNVSLMAVSLTYELPCIVLSA
jgi:hypothetical protein